MAGPVALRTVKQEEQERGGRFSLSPSEPKFLVVGESDELNLVNPVAQLVTESGRIPLKKGAYRATISAFADQGQADTWTLDIVVDRNGILCIKKFDE